MKIKVKKLRIATANGEVSKEEIMIMVAITTYEEDTYALCIDDSNRFQEIDISFLEFIEFMG